MKDYGAFWTDYCGQRWPIVRSARRLKFRYPAHAALRRHVFQRDGYACAHCGAAAAHIPDGYDGRSTLLTNTKLPSGYPDMLVLDHILTQRAGGRSVVENLQTLCETCNKRKIRHDIATTAASRAA